MKASMACVWPGFEASKPGQFERTQPLSGEILGCKMDLGVACTQLSPQLADIETAASMSHQLTRWSTS
jgi:hypothetical protein